MISFMISIADYYIVNIVDCCTGPAGSKERYSSFLPASKGSHQGKHQPLTLENIDL